MILKRNDMISRFEEIVKQEIINHNAQINRTNIAINDMKKSILLLQDKVDENKAIDHSSHQKNSDAHSLFYREVNTEIYEILSRLNNLKSDIVKQENDIKDINLNIETLASENVQIDSKFPDIVDSFRKIEDHFICIEQNFNQKIKRMEEDFIIRLKEEVINLSLPSQLQHLSRTLLDRIDECKSFYTGIIEENTILKHDMFIMKKHIEKLFNIIEDKNVRLRGK